MKSYVKKSVLIFVSIVLSGCGLTAPKSNDGYVDLDALGALDAGNTMTLSFGPTLLRFASGHIDDDPTTRDLLRGLDGIRIKLYEIDGDASRVAELMEGMNSQLREQDWESIVVMQENGEQVYMLIKMVEGSIVGLTILASDAGEAVIVNVMGDIRPEMFTKTMAALDVELLELRVVGAN